MPSSVCVPNLSASSSSAFATRPGTSVKIRLVLVSVTRRSRCASALSSSNATGGRVASTLRRSSWSIWASRASVMATAVDVRYVGSNIASSPNMSPGPCTLTRLSLPSGVVLVSFTFPLITRYRQSPRSPSSNSRSPRGSTTTCVCGRNVSASWSLSSRSSGLPARMPASSSVNSSCWSLPSPPTPASSGSATWTSSARPGLGLVVSLLASSEPLSADLDLVVRCLPAHPPGRLHFLARLERLVHLEEVLNLEQVEFGDVTDVVQVRHPRVGRRNAQDLVVAAFFVAHAEHADRATPDHAAGEGRLLQRYQSVEGVAVLGQRVLDEPVVGGVTSGGEQHPVQSDPARIVIHLVLVALTLGDLDDYIELHGRSPLPARVLTDLPCRVSVPRSPPRGSQLRTSCDVRMACTPVVMYTLGGSACRRTGN